MYKPEYVVSVTLPIDVSVSVVGRWRDDDDHLEDAVLAVSDILKVSIAPLVTLRVGRTREPQRLIREA